jgi:hypothetical protein
MRCFQSSIAIASCTLMLSAGVAFAAGQPSKPSVVPTTGQPGVGTSTGPSSNPTHACGSSGTSTPGGAVTLGSNSVFNSTGQASAHYAGNMGTASAANANSAAAVSQYDIACFQVP